MQAKTKLLRAGFVLAIVGAAVFATAPSANADPTAGPTMVRHYGDGSGTVAGVGQAQCALPTSARQGAWVCATAVAQPQAGPIAGWCGGPVCEYENTQTSTNLLFEGSYGYGSTTLGATDWRIWTNFSGSASTSYPFWMTSTRAMTNVYCSGERVYFSTAHPGGLGVNGGASYSTYAIGSVPSGISANCNGSHGYSYTETTVAHTAVDFQFQWQDTSSAYPGTWWTFVQTPKFERQTGGGYKMKVPFDMGPTPYASGWDAP